MGMNRAQWTEGRRSHRDRHDQHRHERDQKPVDRWVSAALWRTPYFWWWIGGAIGLGLTVHFIWRWKTRGWTQPWGGWNDVDAASRDGSGRRLWRLRPARRGR